MNEKTDKRWCPECQDAGKKSKVFVGATATTLLGHQPFYDEDGVYHDHNPNTLTQQFTCSNGHKWERRFKNPCPNCNYE